jgi:TnpA family transposase
MIKYATAIRTGTTSTEAILRRFTKANALDPAYQAMAEVDRAQRTIFLARFLRDRDLQREINEGLNVVESWNRANSVTFYGKDGDIATNRRDEQELSVLWLRDPPGRPGLRQHPHSPGRPRRPDVGRQADRRG